MSTKVNAIQLCSIFYQLHSVGTHVLRFGLWRDLESTMNVRCFKCIPYNMYDLILFCRFFFFSFFLPYGISHDYLIPLYYYMIQIIFLNSTQYIRSKDRFKLHYSYYKWKSRSRKFFVASKIEEIQWQNK